MRDRLTHRGPDSAGEHIDTAASLGVRRLRVIDLITGEQPIANEDGTIWTVFNGEIYNYRELRERLTARGHVLRTQSDTEVIPHLYEDHGPRFVDHLAGMFAIAVWDQASRTLVLARDRLGKKPLLYAVADGELIFASEHAALLDGLRRAPAVDPCAIRSYLRLGYVPGHHDVFQGVQKLPPAHYLVWQGGDPEVVRYWQPPASAEPMDEVDAVSEFRRLFDLSVRRRLIADVPLGALLSGGVDSSAVVASMAAQSARVRTFSIGFQEAEFSELEHARRIAERFGTEHHEFLVRPEALDVLPELVRHYGEPYADSSAIPTYYLTRLTREHVTVALDGDGGDELFAGYERYDAARYGAILDRVPRAVRTAVAIGAHVLPDSLSPRAPLRRVRRFADALPMPAAARYLRWLGVFDEAALGRLLDPHFERVSRAGSASLAFDLGGSDPVRAAQSVDLRVYLPDDLLVKMDIASMANSLEVRCPFLDHELVEFAWRLPTELKIRGGDRKYLVKRAFEGILPRENMYRTKQGFGVPVGPWMRGPAAQFVEELLLSPSALARGYFRPAAVRTLVLDHTRGRADHAAKVWSLLMLELWHREFSPG